MREFADVFMQCFCCGCWLSKKKFCLLSKTSFGRCGSYNVSQNASRLCTFLFLSGRGYYWDGVFLWFVYCCDALSRAKQVKNQFFYPFFLYQLQMLWCLKWSTKPVKCGLLSTIKAFVRACTRNVYKTGVFKSHLLPAERSYCLGKFSLISAQERIWDRGFNFPQ